MNHDAGSARRRPGGRPLYLEPLEDRQLLSGINPPAGSQTPPPEQGPGVAAVVSTSTTEADRQPTPVSPGNASGPTAAPHRETNPGSYTATSPNNGTPDGDAGETYGASAGQSMSSPSTGTAGGSAQKTDSATPGPTPSPGANAPAGGGASGATADPYGQKQPSTASPTPDDDRGPAYDTAGQTQAYSQYATALLTSAANTYAAYGQTAQGATPAEQAVNLLWSCPQLSDILAPGAVPAVDFSQPTGPSLAAEAMKGLTDPVGVVHLHPDPDPDNGTFASALHRASADEIGSAGPVIDPRVTAPTLPGDDPTHLAPQLGSLIVGALPADLTTLNRAVDEFFSRLEGLGGDAWALPATGRLAPWALMALMATGAFEFARRRLGSADPPAPFADGGDSEWDLSTVLALVPPEDVP